MKLKDFFIAKESHENEQITYRMGKILSNYIPDRKLIAKIYKGLQKLHIKGEENHSINKFANNEVNFQKLSKESQMFSKYLKNILRILSKQRSAN